MDIYYIQDNINRGDISMLNSNQKNWNTMDYINYYTLEKASSFIQLSSLINNYPEMTISALLSLSNSEGRRDLKDLKRGILDVSEIDHAREISDICRGLNKDFRCDFVFDSRFPLALSKAVCTENFSIDILIQKISANPRAFVRVASIRGSFQMICFE